MIYWGRELTHTSYHFWNYFSEVRGNVIKIPVHVCTADSMLLLHICSTLKCLSYGCSHQIYDSTENLSKDTVYYQTQVSFLVPLSEFDE